MIQLSLSPCVLLGIVLVALAQPGPARATLGEAADSVESDRSALSAVRRSSQAHSRYAVQEMDAGGTNIREYLSPEGLVFGIAWNGLTHPDLSKLLGAYAEEYRAEQLRRPKQHGHRTDTIKANRVVVQKWGHMRHLGGRAYLPSLLPTGVMPDEIK